MRCRRGNYLTKAQVLDAINRATKVYVVYTEPDPQDDHHSMEGVGQLFQGDSGVCLRDVPNAQPRVQDVFAFEELPITAEDRSDDDAVFTDDFGNDFEFFVPVKDSR